MRERAGLAVLLTTGLLVACEPTESGGAPAAETPGAPTAALALEPVVKTAIAELEARLAQTRAAAADEHPEPDAELHEHIEGLLSTLSEASDAHSAMRRIAIEELGQLGPEAAPVLESVLVDRERPPALRKAAAQALARLGGASARAGAAVLLAVVEASRGDHDPEPWFVAECAWRLGETEQDWIVPRLVLCMRYEKDHETVLWISSTLAGFGNFAGLQTLGVVAQMGTPELAARAAGLREELALAAGFADAAALERAWFTGEALAEGTASPARELEVWKTILALSEWQLRGVDDGRFVLSRLGVDAAALLARALGDEDLYVRVHSAQCLERMGPRAAGAGAALVRALDDPALAAQAAAALGGLGQAEACAPLIARLAAVHPLELRVAAARALGALDCTEADAPLGVLLESDEAIDLRAAAAGCLVRSGPMSGAAPAVRLLAGLLTSGEVEPTVVEADLEAWLGRGGPERVPEPVREAWYGASELGQEERLELRAGLVRSSLR